jgi:hypothetical protein
MEPDIVFAGVGEDKRKPNHIHYLKMRTLDLQPDELIMVDDLSQVDKQSMRCGFCLPDGQARCLKLQNVRKNAILI